MSLWTFLGFAAAPRRVTVYSLMPMADGQVEAVPVGTVPAPSTRFEDHLRTTRMLAADCYVVAELQGNSVVLLWLDDGIAAMCFREQGAADCFPGFEKLTRQQLAGRFEHFSGMPIEKLKSQGKPPQNGESRYEVV